MKSKIFKIVLPAFALVFAITASLAFTPAENSMVDDVPVTSAWAQSPDENNCTLINPVDCETITSEVVCTAQLGPATPQVYRKNAGGICNVILFRPVQP